MAEPGREMLTRGTGIPETLALGVRGFGNIELRVWLGVLGDLGGIAEAVGESVRCIREVGIPSSSSSLSDMRLEDLNEGTGILLGVLGRGRGLITLDRPKEDVARDDGRLTFGGLMCVLGVDNVEFDGDHGREDA